jgi:NADPH:quinone reductase-like Zn-dependent oxidoreductase
LTLTLISRSMNLFQIEIRKSERRAPHPSFQSSFMINLFNLMDRVVLVTGATGALAGSAADYLAAQGARVVYLGRGQEKLDAALAKCRAKHPTRNASDWSPMCWTALPWNARDPFAPTTATR